MQSMQDGKEPYKSMLERKGGVKTCQRSRIENLMTLVDLSSSEGRRGYARYSTVLVCLSHTLPRRALQYLGRWKLGESDAVKKGVLQAWYIRKNNETAETLDGHSRLQTKTQLVAPAPDEFTGSFRLDFEAQWSQTWLCRMLSTPNEKRS